MARIPATPIDVWAVNQTEPIVGQAEQEELADLLSCGHPIADLLSTGSQGDRVGRARRGRRRGPGASFERWDKIASAAWYRPQPSEDQRPAGGDRHDVVDVQDDPRCAAWPTAVAAAEAVASEDPEAEPGGEGIAGTPGAGVV
jgi:hypothetical protein